MDRYGGIVVGYLNVVDENHGCLDDHQWDRAC